MCGGTQNEERRTLSKNANLPITSPQSNLCSADKTGSQNLTLRIHKSVASGIRFHCFVQIYSRKKFIFSIFPHPSKTSHLTLALFLESLLAPKYTNLHTKKTREVYFGFFHPLATAELFAYLRSHSRNRKRASTFTEIQPQTHFTIPTI